MRIWKAKSNWLHTEKYYVDKKKIYYDDKQIGSDYMVKDILGNWNHTCILALLT